MCLPTNRPTKRRLGDCLIPSERHAADDRRRPLGGEVIVGEIEELFPGVGTVAAQLDWTVPGGGEDHPTN